MGILAAVRIRGRVGVRRDIKYTMELLRLNRKFHCMLMKENEVYVGMLRKCKDYLTWGKISDEFALKLLKKRGEKKKGEKLSEEECLKVLEEVKSGKLLKRPIRLHPPRKGLKSSKIHYPKGDLGERENIEDLIKRMM